MPRYVLIRPVIPQTTAFPNYTHWSSAHGLATIVAASNPSIRNSLDCYQNVPADSTAEVLGSSIATELESSVRLGTQRYIACKSRVDCFKDGVPVARKSAPDGQIVGCVVGAEYGVGWVGLRNDDA